MSMDSSSIASLYAAEHRRLERMLMRRGLSAQSAADAVQDAFLRLLRGSTRDVRDLRSYVRRTAETVAIDHHRSERRAGLIVDRFQPLDENVADPLPLAEEAMISGEDLAALAAAMRELPPRTREVLVLHRFDGLSYAEISDRLGIAKNTVMVHMVKALGCLKSTLRENNPRDD